MVDIELTTVWGGMAAVGGFFAWVIRYLLQDLHKVVESNTEAMNGIKLTLEKCKFVQGLK